MPLGVSNKNSASTLNPDEDFASLGSGSCTIQSIYTAQRSVRNVRFNGSRRVVEWKCFHDYTYFFTYSEGSGIVLQGGQVLESRTESHLISEEQCPPTLTGPHRGKFYTGERAECWEPTKPSPWAPEYRCGNPACIKVLYSRAEFLLHTA